MRRVGCLMIGVAGPWTEGASRGSGAARVAVGHCGCGEGQPRCHGQGAVGWASSRAGSVTHRRESRAVRPYVGWPLQRLRLSHNRPVPEYWTAARIAAHVHQAVLKPAGFSRSDRQCSGTDGGLGRTVTFYTSNASSFTGTGSSSKVEMVARVAVTGLPHPVTSHRHDSLGGAARTSAGRHFYPLPTRDEDLPPDLLADASGPVMDFLLRASGLEEFVIWAQEVFAGDGRPGWWGRFQPVFPQGTGPLQAAAFAAAALADAELVEFLVARVENEEASETYFDEFLTEVRQFQPGLRHRHPIVRPVPG
jgi:hypothetical protein